MTKNYSINCEECGVNFNFENKDVNVKTTISDVCKHAGHYKKIIKTGTPLIRSLMNKLLLIEDDKIINTKFIVEQFLVRIKYVICPLCETELKLQEKIVKKLDSKENWVKDWSDINEPIVELWE